MTRSPEAGQGQGQGQGQSPERAPAPRPGARAGSNDARDGSTGARGRRFADEVAAEAERRLGAEGRGRRSFWRHLGALGVVGWAVALPAVGGALLGRRLDAGSGRLTWTLGLLLLGLAMGGYSAWRILWRT